MNSTSYHFSAYTGETVIEALRGRRYKGQKCRKIIPDYRCRIIVFMRMKHLYSLTGYGCEPSMCVAVPAEVLEIKDGNIGVVDYGDLKQEVRLDLVDVKIGEFVLVHVGFAIQRLSREDGLETREIFKQVYAALEE
jgi:hydrogenase expression/formation protein HypC